MVIPLRSRRASRAAALLLLGLMAAAVHGAVVAPVLDGLAEERGLRETALRLIAAHRARGAERPRLEAEIAGLRAWEAGFAGWIEAQNDGTAAAELAGAVRAVLEPNGAVLRSIQAQPTVREGSVERLSVRIDATVDGHRLLDLLHGLDSATAPLLQVSALDIRGFGPAGGRPGLGLGLGPADGGAVLAIRADVSAFRRSGGE